MAIYHYDIDQGSESWFRLRMGIPTASEFKKIITPKTMKLSSQAHDYAILKLAEIMTGEYQGIQEPTYYMDRGKLLENEAIEAENKAKREAEEKARIEAERVEKEKIEAQQKASIYSLS